MFVTWTICQHEQDQQALTAQLEGVRRTSESQRAELQQNLATLNNQVKTLEQALQAARQNSNRLETLNETLRKQIDDVRHQMEISGNNAKQKLEQELAAVISHALFPACHATFVGVR